MAEHRWRGEAALVTAPSLLSPSVFFGEARAFSGDSRGILSAGLSIRNFLFSASSPLSSLAAACAPKPPSQVKRLVCRECGKVSLQEAAALLVCTLACIMLY